MPEPDDPYNYSDPSFVCVGVLALLSFIFGFPANILSFYHFIRQKKDVATIIYICMTFTDIVTSVTVLPVSIRILSNRTIDYGGDINPLETNNFFCNLQGAIFNLTSSMSAFFVAILSITRCVMICAPFTQFKKRYALIPMGACLLYSGQSVTGHRELQIKVLFHLKPTKRIA